MRISDWSSDVCSSDLKPDGRWRKLAADKPALMLCHTGAEDARTESGEQNAQDMDHAVASVPRALRIREDVGRVTRDAILAAQAKLAASSRSGAPRGGKECGKTLRTTGA